MSSSEAGTETSTGLSLGDELTQAFDAETPGERSENTASNAQDTSSGGTVGDEQNAGGVLFEAPQHWAEADRNLFGKAPREIQQRWLDREKQYQKGFDAKAQELAGLKRDREQFSEVFAPYDRDLELNGMSRHQFVGSLLAGHKYLQDSPREALLWLASQYGVDPKTLLESDDAAADPRIAALTKEVTTVKSQFQGFLTEAQQREHSQRLNSVQSFAEAKGEDGKPAHPYFDEVSEDVLRVLKAMPGTTLDVAYNKALRMNDQVWEKLQSEKLLKTSQSKDRQRMQEVDRAKRAAVGQESSSANGAAKAKSLEEELRGGFENWSGF